MKKKLVINIIVKMLLLAIFIYGLFSIIEQHDIKRRFMKEYAFNLKDSIIYSNNIIDSLKNDRSISPTLLVNLNKSINSQLKLTKILNTNFRGRLPVPIADIDCYNDAIDIITYKVLKGNYTAEDMNVLQIICSDFYFLEQALFFDNQLDINKYKVIRGKLRLFSDIDISEYIIEHNYIFISIYEGDN